MSENKNLGGRPPKFETKAELEQAINEYFDYCDNRVRHVYSKKRDDTFEMIDPAPYTMAGLAFYLHMDRTTLFKYGKDDRFFNTIKAARDRVAMDVENRLMEGGNAAGAIFNLKNNFGYTDATQVEQSGAVEIITRKHSSKG